MTVLSACQDAIARLVARRPDTVFASSDEICVEIASLANEAAADIAKAADWRALTKLKIINGDGVTQNWPLPDDYDRMVNGLDIHSGTWVWMRYQPVRTLDDWLDLQSLLPAIPPGYWIIMNGQMSFLPVISTDDDARFYYISNQWAKSKNGNGKGAFDNDTDLFLLEDRLLTLALIWRWKSMKGLDYQEDIRNYDMALSQAMARDRGARVIRKGGGIRSLNVGVAWPWPLGDA